MPDSQMLTVSVNIILIAVYALALITIATTSFVTSPVRIVGENIEIKHITHLSENCLRGSNGYITNIDRDCFFDADKINIKDVITGKDTSLGSNWWSTADYKIAVPVYDKDSGEIHPGWLGVEY